MNPLEFELHIPNTQRALSLVTDFSRQVVEETSLRRPGNFGKLLVAAARHLIDTAYLPGESGKIIMAASISADRIEVRLRDFGIPRDVDSLERGTQQGTCWASRLPFADSADELHWKSFGPEGKELTISKATHDRHITETGRNLAAYSSTTPKAAPQEYRVRRMVPDDALAISQAIYRAYGTTYTNPDIYYPERVAAENASGSIISFVAEAGNGDIVGHYALERNQAGPVAEGGQAVVDPAHRGRGLLGKMKAAALAHGRELGLKGVYASAVTLHVFTQKANLAYGAHLCSADLSVIPGSETLRAIDTPKTSQRETLLVYFIPFAGLRASSLSVPEPHRRMVSKIYEQFGVEAKWLEPSSPAGHGTHSVRLDARLATATITVHQIGSDTVNAVRNAKRELIEQRHAEVVLLQLPINDPTTATVANELAADGFHLTGIGPWFLAEGDSLRLAYLTEPVDPTQMKFQEPFGEELVRYAIG